MDTTPTAAATPVAEAEPTLAGLLQAVPAFADGTDLGVFVAGLVADASKLDKRGRDALVAANVRRYRIGQAWAKAMPKKRQDREAWMRAQGEAHGIGLTRVRQIVRASTALDVAIKEVSADGLPIAVLDRKLEAIPVAVKAVLDGRDPDVRVNRKKVVPTTPEERRVLFLAKVEAAIKAVFVGNEGEVPAALDAIYLPTGTAAAAAAVDPPKLAADGPAEPPGGAEEPRVGPVMQYAGGKTFVAPLLAQVLGRLPEGAELREPFCGGASVSIQMLRTGRATRVWLNDLDPVVQAVWNAVIQEPNALGRALDGIVHGETEFKALRKAVSKLALPSVELAASAIYCQKVAMRSVYKGEFKPDARWDAAVTKERVRETHELLCGRVVHGKCTGLDALEVIRAPGNAVLFLDPPYWRCGVFMYRKAYKKEAEFTALAEALKHHEDGPNHPWLMTIGDDEVSDRMLIPGARTHRIRSGVKWKKTAGRLSGVPGGEPHWLLDLDRDDAPKRELLITSDAASGWSGLPQLDPALWEMVFGEGDA
jgi:DNA adenine methylase